jgi:hypothetical protein
MPRRAGAAVPAASAGGCAAPRMNRPPHRTDGCRSRWLTS